MSDSEQTTARARLNLTGRKGRHTRQTCRERQGHQPEAFRHTSLACNRSQSEQCLKVSCPWIRVLLPLDPGAPALGSGHHHQSPSYDCPPTHTPLPVTFRYLYVALSPMPPKTLTTTQHGMPSPYQPSLSPSTTFKCRVHFVPDA